MDQQLTKHHRLVLANCENLFLYMDGWQGQTLTQLNEKEWQALNRGSVRNKPMVKVKWLAETIRELNPDFLLLNEVGGRESLENFNRHFLGGEFQEFWLEGNSKRGIDVAYLIKKELTHRCLVFTHRNRPLNFLYPHAQGAGRSEYLSRDVLELRCFSHSATAPSLIFLLVHLKSKLDPDNIDPRGRLRREAELNLLVKIYNEIRAETPNTPIIVAGDFNGQANRRLAEPEFSALSEHTDLDDVFDILGTSITECATQVTIPRSGGVELLKIDHVFVSPELRDKIVAEGCRVVRFKYDGQVLPLPASMDQRDALPSDHYPVLVTFQNLF
jgi:endonuclease/exonuclease/phosphatase family metal-dependent hydrolase